MKNRILFSFAHPDDETFTCGGVLAKYSKDPEIETILYSATLGDKGKCGEPPICTKEELPEVRKKELKNACNILGVDHVITGPYKDKGLSELPVDTLKHAIIEQIQQWQPTVVVTFPPHGLSGHPDHLAIQQATYEAVVSQAITSVQQLYYATMPESYRRKHQLKSTADPDDLIDVAIPIGHVSETVREALLAHKTQHKSIERVFSTIYKDDFFKFDNYEYFIRTWSQSKTLTTELF